MEAELPVRLVVKAGRRSRCGSGTDREGSRRGFVATDI